MNALVENEGFDIQDEFDAMTQASEHGFIEEVRIVRNFIQTYSDLLNQRTRSILSPEWSEWLGSPPRPSIKDGA